MSSNITYNNIEKFEKEIFKKNIKNKHGNPIKNEKGNPINFNFKDFLSGKYDKINIPLIPTIYFNRYSSVDNIGSNIINNYYSIKYKLRELRTIKKYIFTILELSKDEINKKTVSFNKYKLKKNKLIIKFEEKLVDTIKEQNDFNHFKLKYCFEKYNYIKDIKINTPLFFTIFQNEYLGSNKSFFLNLFRDYIKLRNELLKYIDSDNLQSLMAFDKPFFDLKNKLSMEKNAGLNKENIKSNKENYNKYLIYGNKGNNNVNNTNNTSPLYNKIHKFNLLYTPSINDNLYKESHVTKINKIYSELYDNINKLLNSSNNDLFNVTINNIDCDFSIIELLYYYVEPKFFNNAIDNNTKIKKYIYGEINKFELYYEDYLNWYKKLNENNVKVINSSNLSKMDFGKFFESIPLNISSSTSTSTSTSSSLPST